MSKLYSKSIEKEVLITVKAYPNPSLSHQEASCIAGISRDGEWIRLYPVRYRKLRQNLKPRKYDIIKMIIKKYNKDPRPESFFPEENTFEKIGYLDTSNNWRERKEWILPFASNSMCEIQSLRKKIKKSLGIFQPKEVTDFIIEDDDTDWKPYQIEIMKQASLFDKLLTPLEKIPFNFKYRYMCNDRCCRGHTQTIVDWEIHELYRNSRDKHEDDIKSIKKDIRNKFLNELCGPDKDTYFFVGDMRQHLGSFIVLGIFWPQKEIQQGLF